MGLNIFNKILKNKHILVIGIICLIAITCISLASAADVDTALDESTNIDDTIPVVNVDNATEIDNSTDGAITNDTTPTVNPDQIDWDKYNINPDDYKNPTIIHINNVDDLHKAASFVYLAKQNGVELIMLIFDYNGVYNIDPWFQYNLLNPTCKMLIIVGNGATIQVNNPCISDEHHFLTNNVKTYVSGLTLRGFNTAIVNYGTLIVDNCIFKDNKLDYWFSEDYGGAIKNYGTALIMNSQFLNNYAKYGGAIWSSADSTLIISNCIFKNNNAYGGGDDIYMKEGCSFDMQDCVFNEVKVASFGDYLKTGLEGIEYAAIGLSILVFAAAMVALIASPFVAAITAEVVIAIGFVSLCIAGVALVFDIINSVAYDQDHYRNSWETC